MRNNDTCKMGGHCIEYPDYPTFCEMNSTCFFKSREEKLEHDKKTFEEAQKAFEEARKRYTRQ